MYCANCGAKNDDSSTYCGACGRKLVKPEAQGAEARQGGQSPQEGVGAPAASKKSGQPVVIALVVCLLVIAAIAGLFASGIVKLNLPSQGSGSSPVAASGASQGASGESQTDVKPSATSAGAEQAALSFSYVNLGAEDAPYVYPVFSGGSNASAVEQLNERLKSAASEAHEKREFKSTNGTPFYYETWKTTVTFLEGDTVGLIHAGYAYSGGAHGYPQCWSEVIDLRDGSTTDAWKFVGLSQDERDRQTRQLADDFFSKTGEHDLYTTSDEVFEFATPQEYADNNELAYVLTADGVYVYYGPYLLGSYAFGPRTLLMCDRTGKYVGDVKANPENSYPRASDSVAGGNAGAVAKGDVGAGSAETQQAPSGEQSEYHVVTDDFEFDIPEYWRGKVSYFVKTNNEGMPSVTVYPVTSLTQDPETVGKYRLVTIEAVSSDSPVARNAGDYVNHISGRVEAGSKTIVVHSTNWPSERVTFFYNNPSYGGSSQEIELMSALVDLSSGGSITYGEVKNTAGNIKSIGDISETYARLDIDFLETSLMPTLRAR